MDYDLHHTALAIEESKQVMDKEKAKRIFEAARVKVDVNARTFLDFDKLSATDFLEKYCWVVFASGFRNKIVKANFPAITVVFKNFDLDALADLKPIKRDALPIQNKLKADNFLKGCKMIAREGFDGFKSRVSEGGMDVLQELPWIGDVTKYHLAMNIGLQDTAKPDIWLKRCAESCSTTVDELVEYLADEYDMEKRMVDFVLWDYCKNFQRIPDSNAQHC